MQSIRFYKSYVFPENFETTEKAFSLIMWFLNESISSVIAQSSVLFKIQSKLQTGAQEVCPKYIVHLRLYNVH